MLTSISDTISMKACQYHFFILRSFIPKQESRQYKGKHLESNPKSCHSTVESMWSSKPHLPHTLKIKWPVQISQVIKKNLQTATRGCFLQQGREGTWDKAEERTEHANTNLRCSTATLLWCQRRQGVIQQYFFLNIALQFQGNANDSEEVKKQGVGCPGPVFKHPATLLESKVVQIRELHNSTWCFIRAWRTQCTAHCPHAPST